MIMLDTKGVSGSPRSKTASAEGVQPEPPSSEDEIQVENIPF